MALESASSGDKCLFMFRGIAQVQGGDTAAKGILMAANESGKAVAATSSTKGIAYMLETNTNDTTLHRCTSSSTASAGSPGGLI